MLKCGICKNKFDPDALKHCIECKEMACDAMASPGKACCRPCARCERGLICKLCGKYCDECKRLDEKERTKVKCHNCKKRFTSLTARCSRCGELCCDESCEPENPCCLPCKGCHDSPVCKGCGKMCDACSAKREEERSKVKCGHCKNKFPAQSLNSCIKCFRQVCAACSRPCSGCRDHPLCLSCGTRSAVSRLCAEYDLFVLRSPHLYSLPRSQGPEQRERTRPAQRLCHRAAKGVGGRRAATPDTRSTRHLHWRLRSK
jgi:hypothetical protein